jgi:hypothetical protein
MKIRALNLRPGDLSAIGWAEVAAEGREEKVMKSDSTTRFNPVAEGHHEPQDESVPEGGSIALSRVTKILKSQPRGRGRPRVSNPKSPAERSRGYRARRKGRL